FPSSGRTNPVPSLAAWIFLLLLPGLSDGGKLLVVPMDGSHWLSMRQVVEKLTERGHEVVVVIPEVSWQMGMTQAYTVKTYPVSFTLEELDGAFHEYVHSHLKGLPFPQNALALYNSSIAVFNVFFSHCKDLFRNRELMQYLNQSDFDALLTDPISLCGAIVANYFSLPFIFFMRGFPCGLHYTATQCPNPLSYVPRLFTFNSDRMTFFQRVENALVALLELGYCNGFYAEAMKFSSEVLQRDVSLLDLLTSASIWLLRFDYVLEYVRPVMPNMIFVGGINCVQKKPLSKVRSFSPDYTFSNEIGFFQIAHKESSYDLNTAKFRNVSYSNLSKLFLIFWVFLFFNHKTPITHLNNWVT
uniref:glucuronosyltransferase n=1 Tax=Apteryx owenii TaxID=8824 RepID=A0A8B9NUK1_APTOW